MTLSYSTHSYDVIVIVESFASIYNIPKGRNGIMHVEEKGREGKTHIIFDIPCKVILKTMRTMLILYGSIQEPFPIITDTLRTT